MKAYNPFPGLIVSMFIIGAGIVIFINANIVNVLINALSALQ